MSFLRRLIEQLGFVVIRRSTVDEILDQHPWLTERLIAREQMPSRPTARVSAAAPSASDPRLAALRRRYAGHPATSHSVWSAENVQTELSLDRFREDNLYVWQTRETNPIQYLLSTYYAKDNDPLGLFDRFTEDGAFRAHTYDHGGKAVSRDMLDSVLEINFLEEQIGLSKLPQLSVLDIGAGYGRLAHRMVEALPNLQRYICTDAVPESTFVSEFYSRYRGIENKVTVAPLDEVESLVGRTRVDLALNIHSFSECAVRSSEFWLDVVARAEVPSLFIVPNAGDELNSWEPDQSHRDYCPLLTDRGYELAVKRDKYVGSRDVQRFGLFPSTYLLYRRAALRAFPQGPLGADS